MIDGDDFFLYLLLLPFFPLFFLSTFSVYGIFPFETIHGCELINIHVDSENIVDDDLKPTHDANSEKGFLKYSGTWMMHSECHVL